MTSTLCERFGLAGVQSVPCGTTLVFADNIGCLQVIDPRAVESFYRARPGNLGFALERAVARVRSGNGRLPNPAAMLGYHPDVSAHAEALPALCRMIFAGDYRGRRTLRCYSQSEIMKRAGSWF